MRVEERSQKIATLLVTGVGFFMVLLDITIVSVALPSIQRGLHASASELSWVINGYTIPFAALLLTFGSLGDRFGRKKLFIAGMAMFTIGSLVCSVSPTFGILIIGRVLQGVGGAAVSPTSLALIAAVFAEEKERTRAIGIWSGITGLALAAGPLLGGLLIQFSGDWRTVFVVNLPLGVLAVVLGVILLPETSTRASDKLDMVGQVLLIGALTPAVFALVQGNSAGWGSPQILICFGGSALLWAAFFWRQSRFSNPMLPLSLFSSRLFSGSSAVTFIVGFALTSNGFFLSQYFQDVQGATALGSGLRTLPITVGIFAVAPIAGRLASRFGYRLPVTIGSLSAGAGLLLLTGLQPHTGYADIWWRLIFIGVGFGLTLSPLVGAVLSTVSPTRAGTASGVNNVARQLGGTLGVAALTAVLTAQFTSNLTREFTQAGVASAAELAQKLGRLGAVAVHTAAGHGPLASPNLPPLVATAFSDAFHVAVALNGTLLILGAIIAIVTLRQRLNATTSRTANTEETT